MSHSIDASFLSNGKKKKYQKMKERKMKQNKKQRNTPGELKKERANKPI